MIHQIISFIRNQSLFVLFFCVWSVKTSRYAEVLDHRGSWQGSFQYGGDETVCVGELKHLYSAKSTVVILQVFHSTDLWGDFFDSSTHCEILIALQYKI